MFIHALAHRSTSNSLLGFNDVYLLSRLRVCSCWSSSRQLHVHIYTQHWFTVSYSTYENNLIHGRTNISTENKSVWSSFSFHVQFYGQLTISKQWLLQRLEKLFAQGSACWGTNGFAQRTAKVINTACSRLLFCSRIFYWQWSNQAAGVREFMFHCVGDLNYLCIAF